MDDSGEPHHLDDRISRTAARLHAAMARAGQAHEQLIVARDRLAEARRALRAARASDVPTPAPGVNPLELDEPP
jgi:outer membrane protein TolC